MATAYSTLLGLALPVQGELSGTWGDMVDNGITRYVDIAVAGTVTLTNDGAVSLSLTNGDSSATNIVSSLTGAGTVSAQFAIIKVTGTLTTAKVLTPPSSSRTYVVVNAATGSTVTVKASGQTGVSIAVGETAFVYFNGTDYVKVSGTSAVSSFSAGTTGFTPSTATTGAVTLAGTLATTNGGTGLASFTNNAVIFASSTTALSTSASFVFDGTLVGIGTSSPQKKLVVSDAGAVGMEWSPTDYTGNMRQLAFNRSTSAYVALRTEASQHEFYISGSEQMRLTSTGLGIGTSSPAGTLHVKADNASSRVEGNNSTNSTQFIVKNTTSNFYVALDSNSGGSFGKANAAVLWMDTANPIVFATNNGEKMRLDSAGNLGLGVTPSAWASYKAFQFGPAVADGALASAGNDSNFATNCYFSSGWKYQSTGYAPVRYVQTSGAHQFYTAASGTAGNAISFTQAMTLDASGNLGIGTTSPSTKLHVTNSAGELARFNGNTSGTQYVLVTNNNSTGEGLKLAYTNTDGSAYLGTIYSAYLGFITNNTERARFSATGGFSVGTTADPGAGAIYATGNITAYYSDARLKTVSGKIENALDKVAQLSGVYYTNNDTAKSFGYDSDEVQVGVLAQDVEAVLPQIVKAAPFDLDQDGNSKSGENYKTVQYERLVPLLIEAINELRAEVKALKGA